MRYSKLEKKLVIELYDKTGNIDYIKDVTGISKKTISTWIKNNGTSFDKINRTEKFITAHFIFEDIYNGYSFDAIMEKRNITKMELYNLIEYYIGSCMRKLKINKRELQTSQSKIDTEKMIIAIQNGETTVSKLAKEHNVTVSAISKRVARYNEKWG